VDALPTENLDALTRSLDQIEVPQIDLATVVSRVENAVEHHPIDAAALRRSIDQAHGLTDLHWRLTKGHNGLGRARFGLAVAPGSVAQWAGMFPHNPFDAPVVVEMTGDAAQLAAGLVAGQMRDTVEAVALVRRARLEIDKPVAADWQRAALGRLAWQDLDAEEQRLCAPLFLVGDDDVLGGRGLAQVLWLLESGLPVKILVLAQLDLGLASPPHATTETAPNANPRGDLGLLALAQRGAYVAQTSIALPAHLHGCIRDALRFTGPALLRIHAPSPERHGFAAGQTLYQARLAVDSRAFPVFRYDPEDEGVFGTRLSLDGNPNQRDPWVALDDESVLTPVSWAMKEQRFRACFRPLSDEDASPTELSGWLELDVRARRAKTPFVSEGEGEAAVRYRIDPALADKIAALAQSWRTLQELAGLVTPFTTRVQVEAEERLTAGHEAEIVALRQEHAEELEALRQRVELEMTDRVREQLKALALTATPEDRAGAPEVGDGTTDPPPTSEEEGAKP
jgi:pyruvate-ferredoxin/flavodoxin oxidoreductase